MKKAGKMNYDALYYLWSCCETGCDCIDDNLLYQTTDIEQKRLSVAREHIKRAALALFPVAYNGLEKKYGLNIKK